MEDELLVRYLVGATTDEETESVDELSIADEAFAVRLRAVEHDLVDAYANGELSGTVLEQFTAHYLSSPAGRAKVDIARAFRAYQDTRAAVAYSDAIGQRGTKRPSRTWLLVAAAALLAIAATFALDDLRLRRSASEARERQLALEQRQRELQDTIAGQRSETAGASQGQTRGRDNADDRASQRPTGKYALSIVLFPATRDAQRVPIVALSKSVDVVALELDTGPDDFPEYRAVIEDAASERVVWRSGPLRGAVTSNGRRRLAITVPANQLEAAEYALKLTGIPATGDAKALDSYPFRVVLQ
jgi:hypothetical protein